MLFFILFLVKSKHIYIEAAHIPWLVFFSLHKSGTSQAAIPLALSCILLPLVRTVDITLRLL